VISFRFHLVSVIAVFLALGLGVLTGTTVLNSGIVDQLERQTDDLVAGRDVLREQLDQVRAETEVWSLFGLEIMDHVIVDRLAGTAVVVVTQEEADDAALEGVRDALEVSGAEVEAVLSADPRIAIEPGEPEAVTLAEIVGAEPTSDDLPEQTARAVADRLVLGTTGNDVLERLLDSGFLRNRGPALDGEALESLGRPRQVVVVVGGGDGEPVLDPSRFLLPLVVHLAEAGAVVAATEPFESQYSFVGPLRGDALVADLIVTQDNIDETPGEVGLILALQELIQQGRAGHYGAKDGAGRLIPPP
jgi:hypothetical protein